MNDISISNHDADVFEDRFTCWNRLPMELKVKVVRNLPYPTLRNFMFLSRECMELTSLLKASVHAIYLLDEEYGLQEEKKGAIVRSFASIIVNDILDGSANADSENYTIGFEGKGCSCIARRIKKGGQNMAKELEYPMESCYAVSMRVLFQITKNLKPENVVLELANIRVVKETLRKLPSTSSITCGALTVRSPDLSFLSMLMPHVTPGCELRFDGNPFSFTFDNVTSGVFDFEAVKAAPFIRTDVDCDISDEQLVHLRASELYLRAPRISEKGLNGLILQWMKGRRKIVSIRISKTKRFNYDMIFENVDKTKVQFSSLELLQIPFFDKYVALRPTHERLALVRNGLDDRLLVNIGLKYCEIVDPYSDYMSLYYR
ncbi:unnamed protein product [Cylicocyclus nassatus]|uniref:F-box domain-containing protein n=1 Tax=Cylicocyclus nassatus TaxID=53992 RepID=A0AA36DV78_CYLNA|nr:unnamed protein product [Cylicocyclus nassatus]